jgi:hypothetical protein
VEHEGNQGGNANPGNANPGNANPGKDRDDGLRLPTRRLDPDPVADVEFREVERARDQKPAVEEQPLHPEPVAENGEAPLTVNEIVEGARGVIDQVGTAARRLVDRGRYRKVRISRKGKPVLPDIPVAAVAAIQAASFYGAGVARVLVANVGAKLLFDIDVVNEADKFVSMAKAALLDGDLERAEEGLQKAVRIDDTHAEAFLELGVVNRLRGSADQARKNLTRARELDETGPTGKRAADILKSMAPPAER